MTSRVCPITRLVKNLARNARRPRTRKDLAASTPNVAGSDEEVLRDFMKHAWPLLLPVPFLMDAYRRKVRHGLPISVHAERLRDLFKSAVGGKISGFLVTSRMVTASQPAKGSPPLGGCCRVHIGYNPPPDPAAAAEGKYPASPPFFGRTWGWATLRKAMGMPETDLKLSSGSGSSSGKLNMANEGNREAKTAGSNTDGSVMAPSHWINAASPWSEVFIPEAFAGSRAPLMVSRR